MARSADLVTRRLRNAAIAVVVATLLGGCTAGSYPISERGGAAQYNPIRVGQPIQASIVFIQVRPGDTIDLLSAEPVGAFDGATVRLFLSRPVIHANGEHVIGEVVEPLEGARVTSAVPTDSPDNNVGIVGELVAQRPGRYEVTSVRLRYRLNGGPERVGEGIDVLWTVCADDPAPADCAEASPAD